MTDKILTVGFIGNGRSANRYHIPYLLVRKEQFHIKTIYARNPGNTVWKKPPDVIYTSSLLELLNDPEIDLVILSTPPESRFTLAKQVIQAGKHCVVEKPFTTSSVQAESLFLLAEQQGVMLQCYQNRRFDSDFLTAQKVMKSGKLGNIFEVEMHADYYRPEVPEKCTCFDAAHSFLMGYGCHMLDQAISFVGIPEHVRYDIRQLLGQGRMNDYFDMDLLYKNKKVNVSSSYFRAKCRPSIAVYGTKGTFQKESADKQEQHLKLFCLPGQPGFGVDQPFEYGVLTWYDDLSRYHEERVISETGDYGRYYDALYRTLSLGFPALVKPEETIAQIRILEKGLAGLS